MSLTLALNSAISGLSTAQAGLNVISSNIANVNTEGYTRKIFEPQSRVLAGLGVGVELGNISNNVDQNLLRDLREERSKFGLLDSKMTYFKRIQDLFGTTSSDSTIAHRVNSLQKEFETLATEPEKSTTHLQAVQAGVTVADQLSRMSNTVQGLRLDADREIERAVQEINNLLNTISKLNDQVSLGAATARQNEDLEDKRDVALNRLSDLIDIQYFFNSNGSCSVFTTDGTTLVDSAPVSFSHAALSQVSADNTYASGQFNGVFAGMRDITSNIRSGKIASLIELRDKILPDHQAQLDEMARNLTEEINLVHNRGTAYPQMNNTLTGTRTFLSSSTQTLTFTGAEPKIVIYDSTGAEKFSSRLADPAGINFTNGSSVDTLASQMQTWLQGLDPQLNNATVGLNADGRMEISLGTDSYGIAFRDEATAVKGSEPEDTKVSIDLDSDGTNDQTYAGFSNFFGFNDYFVTDQKLSTWDSDFKPANYKLGIQAAQTLQFADTSNPTGIAGGSITVNPNDSLQQIADKINQNTALLNLIHADVVPEGGGYKLRIQHTLGEHLVVTQAAGGNNDAILALGLEHSEVGYATKLKVNDALTSNPSAVSRGRVQFDEITGRYLLSPGDNEVATQMSAMLSGQVSFKQAGSLSAANVTFGEYASTIVSYSSTMAAGTETDLKFQSDLKTSLSLKHSEISGVNLDEEMSQLLVFQQTYAASAKIISTTQQLFDILNNIIN
ncbi:MAG: flagellar hook-associated protein FlgK [Rhodospirillaceae bacterium]|nr:flagellar hook-associated protein FlgK [Rhodospirillaceae bacterium]